MAGDPRPDFSDIAGEVTTRPCLRIFSLLARPLFHWRLRVTSHIFRPVNGGKSTITNIFLPRRSSYISSHTSGSTFAGYKISLCANTVWIISRIVAGRLTHSENTPSEIPMASKVTAKCAGG